MGKINISNITVIASTSQLYSTASFTIVLNEMKYPKCNTNKGLLNYDHVKNTADSAG
jgi:hypothetical protein